MRNLKTIYPPTKFADINDLGAQLKHFYSEIKEIRRAQFAYQQNPTPETLRHLIEEVQDSIHSGETLCRIAEAKLGVDVAGVQLGIVKKNRRRKYYPCEADKNCPVYNDCAAPYCSAECPKCKGCIDTAEICTIKSDCYR